MGACALFREANAATRNHNIDGFCCIGEWEKKRIWTVSSLGTQQVAAIGFKDIFADGKGHFVGGGDGFALV